MQEQGAIVCGTDINHNGHVELKKDVSERNGMTHWCVFKVVVFCNASSAAPGIAMLVHPIHLLDGLRYDSI